MKWFKHDSNASMDAKLQSVLLEYGLEGYGLYWYCLELIASTVDKDNIRFELEHDARIIARNTGSSVQKVEEMMKRFINIGLFESSQGIITCLKLALRADDYTAKLVKQVNVIKNQHDAFESDKLRESPTNSEKVRINRIEENRIEEKRREENKKYSDDAKTVFSHWQDIMNKPRAKFTQKRKNKIIDRLKSGFKVDDIRSAIIGCASIPFNMGDNPNKKTYNDIELICRSDEKVEYYLQGQVNINISHSSMSTIAQAQTMLSTDD